MDAKPSKAVLGVLVIILLVLGLLITALAGVGLAAITGWSLWVCIPVMFVVAWLGNTTISVALVALNAG
jgi:hypothetical protein